MKKTKNFFRAAAAFGIAYVLTTLIFTKKELEL